METKIMIQCDMCGSSFQFDPHRYDGKHIARYKITVCMPCWNGNWDGWAPHYEPRFLDLLKRNNIPIPQKNSKGLYPRE